MARTFTDEPVDLVLKRLILKKREISCGVQVPERLIRDSKVEAQMDYFADTLLAKLEAYLASSEHTEKCSRKTVVAKQSVPLTWWDHTKERFAPGWFLFRWPVKYHSIDTVIQVEEITNNIRLCPHIAMDKEYKHVEWLAGVHQD